MFHFMLLLTITQSKINDETQKTLTIKTKHNFEGQKTLTF
jgi:hypothetical protein